MSQVSFTAPGDYTWTAPAGVTSVCVVAVGGGGAGGNDFDTQGGGGGGLAWGNNIPVTPGNSYAVKVGKGGAGAGPPSPAEDGTDSSFTADSFQVIGRGGLGGAPQGTNLGGGFVTITDGGGGNGGGDPSRISSHANGGGGAGGYTGDGGDGSTGGSLSYPPTPGEGGAGGGGQSGGGNSKYIGGGGGGTGIYGEGVSGAGGGVPGEREGLGGGGGSPSNGTGTDGNQGKDVGNGDGGFPGGGGGSNSKPDMVSGSGGDGAVRIIWGPGRAFPSTNTEDLKYIQDDDLFLCCGGSSKKNSKVKASNLANYRNKRYLIVYDNGVDEPTSYFTFLEEVNTALFTDEHYMLLNRGSTSYKVRATAVKNALLESYVEVNKPTSGFVLFGGRTTRQLANSQSGSVTYIKPSSSQTTYDYLWHIGIEDPSNEDRYTMGGSLNSADTQKNTVTGPGFNFGIYRSNNKVTSSNFSSNGSVTHTRPYPPGASLANSGKSYSANCVFCILGGDNANWQSNEAPSMTYEANTEFSVVVDGLSNKQALAIMIFEPTSPIAQVLVDDPNAFAYGTKGYSGTNNWANSTTYLETTKRFKGTINFKCNTADNWVITQVITYS